MINSYGFIGLGEMGKPIATNLLKSSKKLTVYDIDDLENKAPKGSFIAKSLEQLVSVSEIIFISVPDGKASSNVINNILNSNEKLVRHIINLSTIGLQETKPLIEALNKANISYIDAPVSGGKSGAINATITIMWSGSQKLLDEIRDDLDCFSKSIFFVGKEPGQGQIMKLINNYLSAVAMSSTSEAILLGLKNNLDMETMLNVLNVSTGKNSATLDKFPNRILTESYDAAFRMSLMNKDLELYLSEAISNGMPIKIAKVVKNYFQEGEKSLPLGDFTEIYKVIKKI
ncbi:MAG: NAD(P)-dependent oxidoreductase [Alphaproteobacteria bacterium]|jgi:3-hydroxyisobutyrate dehydrogenase-like beta-hydroxyacid dehydrogenase|nr:NAD(P)-dependent oxidoreductase [Alphaproteobacteria bacterium]